MSDHMPNSSPDEEHTSRMAQKKKKRLYTPRTRAKRIITAGPSQDPQVPTAESELLDFRNRVSPPMPREDAPVISTNPQTVSSEYDASCESMDVKNSDHESRDLTESEATLTPAGLRCQESITNDDPQEGLPPTVNAHLSFDAGYLASSDSLSTSDFRNVVARYTQDPDVSQWNQNKNPEIRIHHQIIYDRFPGGRPPLTSRAADSVVAPPGDTTGTPTLPERTRLSYREVGATSSGGSVFDSSVSAKQEPEGEPAADDSRSDVADSRADAPYDDVFEAMLITRIQNRIRELGGVGELELSDEAGLTPAGRQVKQRFGFLMRDASDDETEVERAAGAAGGPERGRRRRRRRAPDWMLTDAPSDETLRTDLDAPPSTASLGMDGRLSERPPPRYSRSPDSESDVSALRDIRAEGGDQFVEAVLWRLHESLRAGNNFREYRETVAVKGGYNRRASHHETSSDDESDAASSRSSAGRVQFKDRVLVRPLGKDPLLTEYRRPYSKVSKQKLSAVKEYSPEPDDPDYEDSLKDKTETAAKVAAAAKAAPAASASPSAPPKSQPGWKKLFCCIGGGNAEEPAAKPAAAAPAQPAAARAAPPPPAATTPELKRKRRRVKSLQVQDLDPDITNEELRSLHMMFDDRVEQCGLSDQGTEASLNDPSELSDPDSEMEPCFSDFLKACALKEDKINDYMMYYKAHRGLTGSGHGDWAATRRSPDGRPASVSSTDDPSWWDKRARERRHAFRRRRREHREYQRHLETQRDLEVEGQLRRALETQRELLREREVEREIERTRESSKERKELRLEEEVLEKELLRRLLAELQNEQVRSREREKRRTVARILEEELITRLTLELTRQREKSEERRGMHHTQRREEESTNRELNNRIEELRMRIEENKILRDYERDEEQERLKLLEELLVKEHRRMGILETRRLEEQDQEALDRSLLTEMEQQSGDDEVQSQKEYEHCARTLLRKNEQHREMRQKLTAEVRKRELVKRKLVSLTDIEKTNPRLFQLAKVMDKVTNEKGCLELEYADAGSGILKKETQAESEGGEVKAEEGESGTKEGAETIGETMVHIKEEKDDVTENASESPGEAAGIEGEAGEPDKTENAGELEQSTAEETGGETDLEPGGQGETTDGDQDDKTDVPESDNVDSSQATDVPSDGEAPAPAEGAGEAGGMEGVDGADRTDKAEGMEGAEGTEGPEETEGTGGAEPMADGTETADTAAPSAPEEQAGPAEPAAAEGDADETLRFRDSGIHVNDGAASPESGAEAGEESRTDGSMDPSAVVVTEGPSEQQAEAAEGQAEGQTERHTEGPSEQQAEAAEGQTEGPSEQQAEAAEGQTEGPSEQQAEAAEGQAEGQTEGPSEQQAEAAEGQTEGQTEGQAQDATLGAITGANDLYDIDGGMKQ